MRPAIPRTVTMVATVLLLGPFHAIPSARADGMLDPSFGNGGKVTTDFPYASQSDHAHSVVVLPDGRAVAAGSVGDVDGHDMGAARYLTSGALDTTFSGDGRAIVGGCPSFGAGGGALDAMLEPDGHLVLVGECPGGYDLMVARLTVDGAIIWTQFTPFPDGVWGAAGVLQPDGRIIAVGRSEALPFALQAARYNTDGSLDSSFGNGGTLTLNLPQSFAAADAVLQADGKLMIAGTFSNGNFGLVRLLPDGALDPSFDGDGVVISAFPGVCRSVVILGDGRIVVGGRQAANLALARYLPNGSLDVTFGTGGLATADSGTDETVAQLVVLPNGKLLAAGSTLNGQGNGIDFLLARFQPDGSLDTSFGSAGFLKTDFNTGSGDECDAVALAGPDLVLTAGRTTSTFGDFALARYIASTPVEALTFDVE